jgi:hypothetical protein
MGQIFTDVSGWALLALLATTIALPFVLRGDTSSPPAGGPVPFLQRLRPHFWLGYGVALLMLAHLWPAMSEGWVRQVDQTGLYLATGAFFLIPIQVGLGMRLRDVRRGRRIGLRRAHFWTMASIAAVTLGHVALNSSVAPILVH